MSAHASRRCRGCGAKHHVTEELVRHLLSAPTFSPERRVSDGVYTDRLFQCSRCPQLQPDGFTCSLCGCIVRVMARDRERRCPWPGASRWGHTAEGDAP